MKSSATIAALHDRDYWRPGSWETKANSYRTVYTDERHADQILSQISTLPPLVTTGEIWDLKSWLKMVAEGNAFVLQGGDCAELFEYCTKSSIDARLGLLVRLSIIVHEITGIKTVMIGRIAGQYGKPRNGQTETVNGVEIPKFHGDIINRYDPNDRQPDPNRLLTAFTCSGITLNYLRSALGTAQQYSLGTSSASAMEDQVKIMKEENKKMLSQIHHTVHSVDNPSKFLGPCFTSHEALFLHYEQAVTKKIPSSLREAEAQPFHDRPRFFNGSAHFVWIGDKTRELQGAHIEYARGIDNPIGVKLGPSTDPAELPSLLRTLDPSQQIGKITLITRLGASQTAKYLVPMIRAVKEAGYIVVWQCDPLHGNTRTTTAGIRTRSFDDVLSELITTIETHASQGTRLGGIHLEMTGDEVVECTGGPQEWQDFQLGAAYKTRCDPRLNAVQAEALVYLAAIKLKTLWKSKTKARI